MSRALLLLLALALAACDERTCASCVKFCKPFAVAECQPGFDGLSPVACKCALPQPEKETP